MSRPDFYFGTDYKLLVSGIFIMRTMRVTKALLSCYLNSRFESAKRKKKIELRRFAPNETRGVQRVGVFNSQRVGVPFTTDKYSRIV